MDKPALESKIINTHYLERSSQLETLHAEILDAERNGTIYEKHLEFASRFTEPDSVSYDCHTFARAVCLHVLGVDAESLPYTGYIAHNLGARTSPGNDALSRRTINRLSSKLVSTLIEKAPKEYMATRMAEKKKILEESQAYFLPGLNLASFRKVNPSANEQGLAYHEWVKQNAQKYTAAVLAHMKNTPYSRYITFSDQDQVINPTTDLHSCIALGVNINKDDIWVIHKPGTGLKPELSTLGALIRGYGSAISEGDRVNIHLLPMPIEHYLSKKLARSSVDHAPS